MQSEKTMEEQKTATPAAVPAQVKQLYTIVYLLAFVLLLAVVTGISLYTSNRSTTVTAPPSVAVATPINEHIASFTIQAPSGYKKMTLEELGKVGKKVVLSYYYNPDRISLAAAKDYFNGNYNPNSVPAGLMVAVGYDKNATTKSGVDQKLAAYRADTATYTVTSLEAVSGHIDIVKKNGANVLTGYVTQGGYPVFILNAGYSNQADYQALVDSLKTIKF